MTLEQVQGLCFYIMANNDIVITWEVSDGYCGGSRPQESRIPRDEWDACECEEERQVLIGEWVQEDFLEKITWSIKNVEN